MMERVYAARPAVNHSHRTPEEAAAIVLPLFHEQAYRFARPEVEGFELTFASPHVVYEKLGLKR